MRILIVGSILLLTSAFVGSQGTALPPREMQADFDVLRRAVEEAHGGLYRFTPKPELDRIWATARGRLESPMSRLEFAAVLSEALAQVRDGHMRLEYDDATTAALAGARLLPLRVAYESGRLIVVSNDTPADSAVRPGMELVSINGLAADAIVKAILPRLSGDGFIETGKTARLARGFPQNYWLYVDQTSTFTVVARGAGKEGVTVALAGITGAERANAANPVNATMAANVAKLDGPTGTIALSFPRGDSVGLLRIRAFDGDTFVPSLDKAVATVHEKRADAVILDLRGNGGGVDMYGAALVSQFLSTPFGYFDRIKVTTIRPSFATWRPDTFDSLKNGTTPAPEGGFLVLPALHPGVAQQKPAAAPFLGKLVVLIDGGTFSTSADVCAQLRSRTQAVFVGEETGGAGEGNTSGLNAQVVLPNSGLKLKVQMYRYWNALGPPRGSSLQSAVRGRGTMPDVTVIRTVADTLTGVDAALDRAFALIRK